MKKVFVFSLFFSFLYSGFSQDNENVQNKSAMVDMTSNIASSGMWVPAKPLVSNIQGSVYLFPNSTSLYKLVTKKGDSRQIFNLNYNLKTRELESMISKDSVFQFDLNQFDYVLHSNIKYKVINEIGLKGLFLEIYNGAKIKLFKETTIIVKEGVFNPMTQTMLEEDKYVQKYTYYFYINDKYEKTKLSKSDVLKYLSDKKDIIKTFAAKNNLSYSSEADVSKILNHYNSL